MSSFLLDVTNELRSLVIATIPSSEATTSNVYRSIAAARMNLVERINGGDFALPIWIIDSASARTEESWGVANETYRCPVKIIEIRQMDETEQQNTIQDHLRLIEVAIIDTPHTNFLAIERGTITTGPEDATLKAFIDGNVNVVAGTLSFHPGLLCGVLAG